MPGIVAPTADDTAANPNTTFTQPDQDTASAALPAPAAAPAQPPTPSETPHAPPQGATGGPPQGVPTTVVQSEPVPQVNKPAIDPRPYAYFAQHDPQLKQIIVDAAEVTGVNPVRIAAHKWAETRSTIDPNVRGGAGEIGPMQVLPGTAKQLDPTGRLDPFNLGDNVLLGARYIALADQKYGKDSPSSIAAYNGGLGGVNKPAAQAYAQKLLLGGDNLTSKYFIGDGSMTPNGLVQAGVQGGPTGFMRYMAQTAPRGMPMSDQWRHAEGLLVNAFISKGDIEGAQHARDFVLQQSHVGSNQYLMAAHQALLRGDGIGAAQALANAHAFFPDDTIGRFRSDGTNVWAERVDEHDPSRRIGAPFMVHPQDVAGMLIQTRDPSKYLQTVVEQQKAAAYARSMDAHGAYYAGLNQERQYSADTRAQAQIGAAQIRADALRDAAATRAGAPDKGLQRAIDKESDARYSELLSPDLTAEQRIKMSGMYGSLRNEGLTPPQAETVTKGLSDKTLHLLQTSNGNFAVANPDGKPIAYISREAVQRTFGIGEAPQPQRSPVGAAAGTPYMMGTQSNLAGTQQAQPQAPLMQSSSVPTPNG